jgi:hypothetical protein
MRPALCAVGACAVEGRDRQPERVRIAADLVQRDEAVVRVERSVFDAFAQ